MWLAASSAALGTSCCNTQSYTKLLSGTTTLAASHRKLPDIVGAFTARFGFLVGVARSEWQPHARHKLLVSV